MTEKGTIYTKEKTEHSEQVINGEMLKLVGNRWTVTDRSGLLSLTRPN